MHKEYYETTNLISLVARDSPQDRDSASLSGQAYLQSQVPPCLIIDVENFESVDIHGDTKYISAIKYRKRVIT